MALAIPWISSSTLVLAAANKVNPSRADRLDPRFPAMLLQAKITMAHMDILGDSDV